jgi:hypothetical protein
MDLNTIEPSESAETIGKSAGFLFLVNIGLNFGVNILTGGSMEMMWSMTN